MPLTLSPETEARLLRLAAEQGTTPDAVIENFMDNAPHALPEPAETDAEEQARLHREFAVLLEEARAVSFAVAAQPLPQTGELAPEEAEYGRIVTEKFRRQGFNV